jgi:hypothetical protein
MTRLISLEQVAKELHDALEVQALAAKQAVLDRGGSAAEANATYERMWTAFLGFAQEANDRPMVM